MSRELKFTPRSRTADNDYPVYSVLLLSPGGAASRSPWCVRRFCENHHSLQRLFTCSKIRLSIGTENRRLTGSKEYGDHFLGSSRAHSRVAGQVVHARHRTGWRNRHCPHRNGGGP